MNFRAKRWAHGVAATILIVTITACGNRPAADTRPTLAPPVAVPQKTRVLPSPIPRRSTSLPSPVLPTPLPSDAGTVSAPTAAAPTVARPTATRRPPSFSMPGAESTPPPAPNRQNYDAAQVVTEYAADVLGIAVTVVSAGEKTGTLTLPPQVQAAVDAAVNIAGETVAAVLDDGAASVSLGDGTVSGDVAADVQDASLGAFVLHQNANPPADAGSALAMVRAAFPGIADLPFELQETQSAPSGAGKLLLPTPPGGASRPTGNRTEFVFSADTMQTEPDIRNGQMKTVAVSAVVGVLPGANGAVDVFAVVGKGTLAADIGK